MYWYISFLRPPPVSVSSTTREIIITPQVANDLRTELRYEPTEIQYTWQRLSPTLSTPTSPKEITTFIPPQSTYKPISVPLPDSVRIGESWRLGLFSSPFPSSSLSRSGSSLDKHGKGKGKERDPGPVGSLLRLCEDQVDVLGVWSEGIHITRNETPAISGASTGPIRGVNGNSKKSKEKEVVGKSKGKGKEKDDGPKQGRITREFSLPPLPIPDSEVEGEEEEGEGEEEMLRIIEQTSFDLDKKIWDSGLALSSWFWKFLPTTKSGSEDSQIHHHVLGREVLESMRREDDLDILELGSGTGLVSIALSLLFRRYFPDLKRDISITDLESAIPLMNENLSFNSLYPSTIPPLSQEAAGKVTVNAKVLDWDQPIPTWVSNSHPELIVAADVTYNTSAFPSLLKTITSLLNPSSRIKPILILAYKQRDPSERELWEMLSQHNVEMVLIDKIHGVERDYGVTEIWIGKMR